MTIDEAIGILQFQGAPEEGPTIHDFIRAKELGIEALKEVKHTRSISVGLVNPKLPGETIG
ncbi:hypothetical protein ES703_72364 [subsurface metagenome]